MIKYITSFLLAVCFSAQAAPCDTMVFNKVLPTTSEASTILCKSRFVIGYSTDKKSPLWVAEKITKIQVTATKVPRVNAFHPDPTLSPKLQSKESAYVGTAYDKGHMVAFEDVSDNQSAAYESFTMTNIVPQNSVHNRGIWRSLEIKVRNLAVTYGEIYVITGPVFKVAFKLNDGTYIPSHLWKVVYVPSTNSVYTIVIPNTSGLIANDLPKFNSSLAGLKNMNPTVNLNPANVSFTQKRL